MIEWIPGALHQWWLAKKMTPPPLVDYTEEWRIFRFQFFKTPGLGFPSGLGF